MRARGPSGRRASRGRRSEDEPSEETNSSDDPINQEACVLRFGGRVHRRFNAARSGDCAVYFIAENMSSVPIVVSRLWLAGELGSGLIVLATRDEVDPRSMRLLDWRDYVRVDTRTTVQSSWDELVEVPLSAPGIPLAPGSSRAIYCYAFCADETSGFSTRTHKRRAFAADARLRLRTKGAHWGKAFEIFRWYQGGIPRPTLAFGHYPVGRVQYTVLEDELEYERALFKFSGRLLTYAELTPHVVPESRVDPANRAGTFTEWFVAD
jgi:hypothetical protein